jgi:two-component system, chemotaxis family, chemotaxis protein CheY
MRLAGEKKTMHTVLAVDDSPSIRTLVSHVLAQAGFNVVLAEDGLDALAHAREKPFDLVLTDINMPNLDGIGLIKELRELPTYKFVPLLVLTTESGTEMKMRGKAAGATGWIVKPFEPEQLVATIRKVLS